MGQETERDMRCDLVASQLAIPRAVPDIVAWEVGGGRDDRQLGQVRKEAAVTDPAWVVAQPPTLT